MRDSVRLADCLVQPPALGFRTHLRRWKWLLASLILQAALVSIGLLVPLLAEYSAPALRTSRAFLFSASERRGSALAGNSSQAQSAAPAGRRKPHLLSVLRQPPVIPSRIKQLADVPAGEALSVGGAPWGVPTGTGAEGILSSGPVILVPEPQPPEPRVVRISQMEPAALLEQVLPAYPQIARQMGLEGTVVLRARIGTDGRVRFVEVETGHPLLAQAARAAVLAWRYRPTLLNGQPVEVETRVVVNFQLQR